MPIDFKEIYSPKYAPGPTALTEQEANILYGESAFNVKSEIYGAIGDGVHDDLSAIQAAVNAAAGQGGGEVIFPPGIYNISGPIVLRSGVRLYCSPGSATIRPHLATGHQHSLICNYRGTQVSGALDTDVGVHGFILDGRSTGIVNDGRMGNGVELAGVTRAVIEKLIIRNMPFSGVEVQAGRLNEINSIRTTHIPLSTSRITVRDITLTHVGWQEPYLTGAALNLWEDAGFGVIVRSGADDVFIENVSGTDVFFNTVGIGQLDSMNDSSTTLPTLANVNNCRVVGCSSDNTSSGATSIATCGTTTASMTVVLNGATDMSVFSVGMRVSIGPATNKVLQTNGSIIASIDTIGKTITISDVITTSATDLVWNLPGAPSFRVAFAVRCSMSGCVAVGNLGSTGFAVRQAGSTYNERITLTNCIADGCDGGFTVNGASSTIFAQRVALVGCHAYHSTGEGFRIEDPSFAMNGCISRENGTYGAWIKANSAPEQINGTITGCVFEDNGTTGAASDAGLVLDGVLGVAVTGCVVADTRVGAARTQDYGIRGISSSDNKLVVANVFRNHKTSNISLAGAGSVNANNQTA